MNDDLKKEAEDKNGECRYDGLYLDTVLDLIDRATLAERNVCYTRIHDAITKVLGESEEAKRVLDLVRLKD